ncbi:hypothetical protein PYCCODRAFT_1473318 [Trametes coccinea BRFM310]|uniref:Uncharacterized protein n=1 Tax=Trametes coccinea (strain BRFM310) TaxID=1353009 RepID=A0A1Y2J939_TRAC3|nr:hypothetical protein PYCCODRAFT_1473318 [Trametes coccinea BRFM310]
MSAADILAATMSAPPPAFDSDLSLRRAPAPTTVEGWTEAIMQGREVFPEGNLRAIRDIGQTIRDVKAAFERVGEGLAQFDKAQYLDSQNNLLQPGGQWKEYEARFQALAERSEYKASAASALLHQYNKAIMTDVDKSELPNLKKELQTFVEVCAYRLSFSVKCPSSTPDILPKKLGSRRADVKRMANEVEALGDDVRFFEGVIDEDLRKAGRRLEEQYGDGSAQQRSLAYHQGAVDSHKTDLERVAQGARMIASIWSMIATDMQALEIQLSDATDPDLPLTILFKKRIAMLRPTHGMLTAVCDVFYNQARGQ